MARPREFEESEALDGAMVAFWRRGFAGTSIADLVETTGMQRQSLYNTFGDKQALFARVLARYTDQATALAAPLGAYLDGEGEALPALRAYALASLGFQRTRGCGSCMIVKTALDLSLEDPAVRRAVRSAGRRIRVLFAAVLKRAQERGEVRCDGTPEALSHYFFAVLNGLGPLAQTGASRRAVEEALDLCLATLAR